LTEPATISQTSPDRSGRPRAAPLWSRNCSTGTRTAICISGSRRHARTKRCVPATAARSTRSRLVYPGRVGSGWVGRHGSEPVGGRRSRTIGEADRHL